MLPVQFVAIFCHIGYQNSSTYAFILFIKQGPSWRRDNRDGPHIRNSIRFLVLGWTTYIGRISKLGDRQNTQNTNFGYYVDTQISGNLGTRESQGSHPSLGGHSDFKAHFRSRCWFTAIMKHDTLRTFAVFARRRVPDFENHPYNLGMILKL